jgi:uncharacterized membrane protein
VTTPTGQDPDGHPAPSGASGSSGDAVMDEKIRKVELAISLVLRIGVFSSVAIMLAGVCLMFVRHPEYVKLSHGISFHSLTNSSSRFPHSLSGIVHDLKLGEGRGVIMVGLIVLILTPVSRVATGVLSFIYEHDPRMALITFFVLCVLVGSFFMGRA